MSERLPSSTRLSSPELKATPWQDLQVSSAYYQISRVEVQSELTVAPEVLYIMLVSILSHIASHSFAIFDLEDR